ncbi:MAG: aldo/keto reductase, partial [Thermotogota bacterium]
MDKEMRRPSKLTLGAVQLGLRYGIANRDGMPDESAAQEILEEAWRRGITSFDKAAAYGESERRIGAFVKRLPELAAHLFIATKGSLEPSATLDDEAYK